MTDTIAADTVEKPLNNRRLFSIIRQRRGWTDQYIKSINSATTQPLQHMDQMVACLAAIHDQGMEITVMPDFDMDGITSGMVGYAGLAELGFRVNLYIPDFRRGHDLTPGAVEELFQRFPQTQAVITCDAGINSHEGIQAIRDRGVVALVTDHHKELEPGSNAHVAVDPARITETYPNPGICGAVVFYKVIEAYTRAHQPEKLYDVRLLKLFAGVGTVSDVMPLRYENRQMVRDSIAIAKMLYLDIPEAMTYRYAYRVDETILLKILALDGNHDPRYVAAFEGFALVLEAFHKDKKLTSSDDITELFYGFYLAPAFNSIRRVEGSMEDAFGAFLGSDRKVKAQHIANVLETNNRRKTMTETYTEQLLHQDQPLAPYVYLTDAPAGMLGLLANKIMRANGLPVVVANPGATPSSVHGGSARSPHWYPVISTLTPEGFQAIGHENACGVRASSAAELSRLAEVMHDTATEIYQRLEEAGQVEAAEPDLVLTHNENGDGSYNDAEALRQLVEDVKAFQPYGHNFEAPVIEMRIDIGECEISTMGATNSHLRMTTANNVKIIWWSAGEKLEALREVQQRKNLQQRLLCATVTVSINVFRGNTAVQAIIDTVRQDPTKASETTMIEMRG